MLQNTRERTVFAFQPKRLPKDVDRRQRHGFVLLASCWSWTTCFYSGDQPQFSKLKRKWICSSQLSNFPLLLSNVSKAPVLPWLHRPEEVIRHFVTVWIISSSVIRCLMRHQRWYRWWRCKGGTHELRMTVTWLLIHVAFASGRQLRTESRADLWTQRDGRAFLRAPENWKGNQQERFNDI